jgi:hypothetical protein
MINLRSHPVVVVVVVRLATPRARSASSLSRVERRVEPALARLADMRAR